MSADATGHAWRHAPYQGAQLLVLLAIADLVNDGHENECWMSVGRLASKARCDRNTARKAVRLLEDDGWLECVTRSAGGRASCYRFLFDDDRPVVLETRRPTRASGAGSSDSNPRLRRGLPAQDARVTRAGGAGTHNASDPNPTRQGRTSGYGPARIDVAAQRAAERQLGIACETCLGSHYVLTDDDVPTSRPCPECSS